MLFLQIIFYQKIQKGHGLFGTCIYMQLADCPACAFIYPNILLETWIDDITNR